MQTGLLQTTPDAFGRPLRDLRVSVTDRCNFRCPYCMPAEVYGERYQFLPKKDILSFEEIARVSGLMVQLGVTKVRLTGGEPLVRTGVPKLVSLLSAVPGLQDLTLTTNGYLLVQHAQALRDAGLRRITISLDSLDEEVFKTMNGRGYSPARVLEAVQVAQDVGFDPVKINCVVQKGMNDHTVADLARHFKGTRCIVRFIEYMDVGNLNGWKMDEVVPAQDIFEMINQSMPLEQMEPNYGGEVALRYRYLDGEGEIGIIASVTQPFCGACTRLRLSTDGKLFTCLFSGQGTDLRGPMRSGATDEELLELVRNVWRVREDRYSELRALSTPNAGPKIEMYQIGG